MVSTKPRVGKECSDAVIKVVHCIGGLEVGGAEMMLYKTTTQMNRERVASLVVSTSLVGPIGERIRQAGIPVIAFGKKLGGVDPRVVFKLYQVLKREKPDVLQTYLYEANLYGILAGKLAGVPVIWGIRNSNMDLRLYSRRSRLSFALSRWLSSLPDMTLVNSQAGRQSHIAQGFDGRRMCVIPNGFELDRFYPDAQMRQEFRAELGVGDDTLLVGRIARFDPMKDFATFVQAASLAAQHDTRLGWVMAGERVTQENADLMQAIYSAGLNAHVFLLGCRNDVPRVMAGLEMLVSSSAFGEGFPNVIGEAMACGVPCVVTDVGDSAFAVGETGRVVPPRDPAALANAITSLANLSRDDRQQLGHVARRRVEDHFDIERIVARIEQLYVDLLDGKRGTQAK